MRVQIDKIVLMKHLYIFWGKVIGGYKRGKQLGFPTANIHLHKKIPEGIYASEIKINKEIYKSATFIGAAKTFGQKDYKAEVYILDFDKNIYGKWISVQLFKKIRGNEKFDSEKELVAQMREDVKEVRDFFNYS
jgi:riboflavin kinase / FMN adenylyltransferase